MALAALVGAKLAVVATEWSFYSAHPREIFSWTTLQAGGAFYGGLAFAVALAVGYRWRYPLGFAPPGDGSAPRPAPRPLQCPPRRRAARRPLAPHAALRGAGRRRHLPAAARTLAAPEVSRRDLRGVLVSLRPGPLCHRILSRRPARRLFLRRDFFTSSGDQRGPLRRG